MKMRATAASSTRISLLLCRQSAASDATAVLEILFGISIRTSPCLDARFFNAWRSGLPFGASEYTTVRTEGGEVVGQSLPSALWARSTSPKGLCFLLEPHQIQ